MLNEMYCVKDKRFTPNVSGSEKIVKTKNNRTMMKAKCSICGITKTQFVKKEKQMGNGSARRLGRAY